MIISHNFYINDGTPCLFNVTLHLVFLSRQSPLFLILRNLFGQYVLQCRRSITYKSRLVNRFSSKSGCCIERESSCCCIERESCCSVSAPCAAAAASWLRLVVVLRLCSDSAGGGAAAAATFIWSHKRLKKIFVMPHKELKHLKQRIKDFAYTYMKD